MQVERSDGNRCVPLCSGHNPSLQLRTMMLEGRRGGEQRFLGWGRLLTLIYSSWELQVLPLHLHKSQVQNKPAKLVSAGLNHLQRCFFSGWADNVIL